MAGRVRFEAELRDLILSSLPLKPGAAAQRAELENKSTSDLLITYYNWQSRLVHPHRRQVHRSNAFKRAIANSHQSAAISRVLGKIAVGNSVEAHLSRGILCGWKPGGKASVEDFDLLLNDWGIHHLHVGTTLDPDGFVGRKRSSGHDEVLALIFRHEAAYVLDIMRHGEWATPRLVEAAVRTWPKETLFLPLLVLPGSDYTEAERQKLRRAGALTYVTIDGIPFVSTTMMSTARTTMNVARQAAETVRRFAYLEGHPNRLAEDFERAAAVTGMRAPPHRSPRYKVVATSNGTSFGFGIQEVGTDPVIGVV